jgi:hypothetical protein
MSLKAPPLNKVIWRQKSKRPVSEKNLPLIQKELHLPPDKVDGVIL